jgi:septum formation protein
MHENRSPYLILASGSPRRRQLLEQLGIPFLQKSVDTSEESDDSAPELQVERLAREKLDAWLTAYPEETGVPILTADTTVDLDGRMVGKPADREEAEEMIANLAGRSHRVITALALHTPSNGTLLEREITEVVFAPLTKREIEWYLNSGEWKGVAGGYRIQERGAFLVEEIKGCYYNVMGLPLRLLYGMLSATVPELFSYPD